jgi:Ca2+-binding RTX toxin-like protein
LLIAGSGNDTLIGGTGSATLTGGTGADLFAVINGHAGGAVTITDFAASDLVLLGGYDTLAGGVADSDTQATEALKNATHAGGNTTIALADGTTITFIATTTAQLQEHVFSG